MRFDELKPGDVFKLSDGRRYVLVSEVVPQPGGFVRVKGFRDADPGGQHSYSTRYLAHRELEVYSLDEIMSPLVRLAEWGAVHGRDSYTFADDPESPATGVSESPDAEE